MGRSKKSDIVGVGDVFDTNLYGKIKVINYNGCKDIKVQFLATGFETRTCLEQVLCGSIKDKLARTVCGVGFIGEGVYKASHGERKAYLVWRSMLQRCYSPTLNQSSYSDCAVCEEWHNFQNFAEWFEVNYPHGEGGYELDKDIKIKGNRVYSPETCMFVTKFENLSAKSKRVSLMNGITGEIFHFESIASASKSTGMTTATVCRLAGERKGKCNSDGWFAI